MTVGMIGAGALGTAGLPPWDIHGPTHYVGIMDPLCGMTRAVRYAATGRLRLAWRYNPGAFVLAASALAATVRFVAGASTGKWLMVRLGSKWAWVAVGSIMLVALEFNQQRHAALLVRR